MDQNPKPLTYSQQVENFTQCQFVDKNGTRCEEEGHIYKDKLVPVRLCDQHRNIRHGNKEQNAQKR